MSDALLSKTVQTGYGRETTNGTMAAAAAGISNLNKAYIVPNQEIIETLKQTGVTVPSTLEFKAGKQDPDFAPESTLHAPLFGHMASLMTQNVAESGAGPFIQTVTADMTAGKEVVLGGSDESVTVKQMLGQTGSLDINGLGGIVKQIDVTIPPDGVAKVTYQMLFLSYAMDDDASSDDFTLVASADEILATDLKYALDGAALYSEELTISFIADIVAKRYAGFNDRFPFKFVLNGWRCEGRFTKPYVAAVDSLAKDYYVNGGETSIPAGESYNNMNLVVHPASLAYGAALDTEGQIRLQANIILNTAIPAGDDELKEEVTFTGAYNETDEVFDIQQATLASEAWAA